MDVVIVTEEHLDGRSAMEYADDYYDTCGYGYGSEHDGVMLLLAMEERDWWITTCGYGRTAFTDAGIDYIGEKITGELSEEKYAQAFEHYADLCEDFVMQARNGEPYDTGHLPKEKLSTLWIFGDLGIGMIISLILGLITKSKLKTVRKKETAADYTVPGSVSMYMNSDQLVNQYVTQKHIQKATYAYVPYDENYEWEENITSEAIRMIEEKEGHLTYNEKVFETLVNSDNPGICAYGFSIMRRTTENMSDYTEKQISLAEKVLGAENEPIVYVYGLQAMSNCASIPEIAQFFLKMTEHEDPVVRKYAAEAVTALASAGVDGMTDAAIRLMSDTDEDVKVTACNRAGQLGDERVIEPLTTILNDDSQSALHKYCINGLIDLWYGHPLHKYTSEAAYRACLSYWAKTPRTQNDPSSSDFNRLGSKPGSHFEEWKQKAAYYNPEELGTVLLDVVRDENVSWLARSGAAAAVLRHCGDAQKAELQSIIDGLNGKDADLIRSSYEKNLK